MKKISFIILHYLTFDDTVECIESITTLDFNDTDVEIVIVDNNSYNDSWGRLVSLYRGNNNIHLIRCAKNIGFAKGNNIGYKYAKQRLKSDFIIVLNNDTLIKDIQFINKMINIYNQESYYVLGPDLITIKENCHQNPLNISFNEKKLKLQVINIILIYILEVLGINSLRRYLKTNVKKTCHNNMGNMVYSSLKINVPLHGACLIFSPLFVQIIDLPFYPETFLYMEEDILYYICSRFKFKTCYLPNMTVYHKEDVSTEYLLGCNNRKKNIFIFKHQIFSCVQFIKLVNKRYSLEEYKQYLNSSKKENAYYEDTKGN